ncbi:hypothetical protein J7T55_009833 [Diaporthe amygdali]|uniref:uncharacterized protein n=1 Tax=Phomopsis amygdali TaxID=1214568 RepID=UPI0022FEAEF5|nr:uncharacterized protein J7T55_009833 [Diaporthe amygdali]KAJ0116683.1 hypothetical protein J7T55_009833 [Diaporthe amygdali]
MDNEVILDCIVVAVDTDRPFSMAPQNEPSTSGETDAAEYNSDSDIDDVTSEQEQGHAAINSPSSAAAFRRAKSHISTLARSTLRMGAISPSRPPGARQSSGSNSNNGQPRKQALHDSFLTGLSRNQQSVRHSANRQTESAFKRKEEDPRPATDKFAQSRFAPINVITIDSDDDDEIGSDDEPLAVVRKRKHSSAIGHPSGLPPIPPKTRKAKSTPTHIEPIRTIKLNSSYAESVPPTANKRPRPSYVSETDSEVYTDVSQRDDDQRNRDSKRLGHSFPPVSNYAIKESDSSDKSQLRWPDLLKQYQPRLEKVEMTDLDSDPHNACAVTGEPGAYLVDFHSAHETFPHLKDDTHDLEAKLSQQEIKLLSLSHQLDESRAIAKMAIRGKLENDRELTSLKDDLKVSKATIESLQQKLEHDSRDERIAQLEASEAERKKQTGQLRTQIHGLEQQVDGLETSEANMKKQTGQLRTRIQDLEHQCERFIRKSLADDAMIRQVNELQKRLSSKMDETKEQEQRIIGLSQELHWHEELREKENKEWHERYIQEQQWRTDLLATIRKVERQ